MDSHALVTVWMFTAIGLCFCQSKEIAGPLNGLVGGSVEFNLTNLSKPPDSFSWSFGSQEICFSTSEDVAVLPPYVGRLTGNRTTAAITLHDLTTSDAGEYTLDITNNGTSRSLTEILRVFENVSDVAITISSNPDPLLTGGSVSLTCEANGNITTREWMRNGGNLSPEPDRVTFSEDNRIVSINPVQITDEGTYQCEVSNPASGPIQASKNLTVYYVSEVAIIQEEGHRGEVEVDNQIHLTCLAECVPECTYTWILNGKPIETHRRTFYIKEKSVHEDSGNYTCTASNTAGTNKGDLYVYVKVPWPVGLMVAIGIGCTVLGIIIGIGISRCLVKIKWFREFLLGGTDQNGISQERRQDMAMSKNTGNQHQQSQ